MNITLNIGLNVSKNYMPEGVEEMQLAYSYAKEYLEQVFGKPMQIGMAQSATEKTIVVQYADAEVLIPDLMGLF